MKHLRNVADEIRRLLEDRILILDGAMGTMIQAFKLDESGYRGKFKDHPAELKGNNDLLNITQPELIKNIHRQYLEAGADLIETNTFNSNTISMSDYKMESMVYELNLAGARLARQVADEFTAADPSRPRFVAGSVGPTNRTQIFFRLASTALWAANRCGPMSRNFPRSLRFTSAAIQTRGCRMPSAATTRPPLKPRKSWVSSLVTDGSTSLAAAAERRRSTSEPSPMQYAD